MRTVIFLPITTPTRDLVPACFPARITRCMFSWAFCRSISWWCSHWTLIGSWFVVLFLTLVLYHLAETSANFGQIVNGNRDNFGQTKICFETNGTCVKVLQKIREISEWKMYLPLEILHSHPKILIRSASS